MRPVNAADEGSAREPLGLIARLFAAAILRLPTRGLLAAGPDGLEPKNPANSDRQGLELSGDRRLSVGTG